MAIGELNLYKTAYCLDAYSKDGSYDDPIFPFPPNYFRGDLGQARDIQVWLKNDGELLLKPLPDQNSEVYPFDNAGTDESTWVKLATTQAGLTTAIAGAALQIPDLEPEDVFTFWIRVTVPSGWFEEWKQDVRIAASTFAHPVNTYMNALFAYSYDIAAKANNLSYSYDIEAL